MKKLLTGIIVGTLTLMSTVLADVTVVLNGENLEFPDQPPIIENGRTLVPMRHIFEALGAKVEYSEVGDEKNVKATKSVDGDYTFISMTIGKPEIIKICADPTAPDGISVERIELDVPPNIYNDRTLVPVRAVSESFGLTVDWNPQTQEVTIVS